MGKGGGGGGGRGKGWGRGGGRGGGGGGVELTFQDSVTEFGDTDVAVKFWIGPG